MTKNILVAVAWPYANSDLHLGHVTGHLLPADIFARYHRLKGNKVLMVSGSDVHGTPITVAADKQGVSPRQIFEKYHGRFLTSLHDLGISFDLFTHTDTENHQRVAQDIFCRLYENGYIQPKKQTLLYSESAGRFLPDRYVEGICPLCGYGEARGDQCDECSQLLDAADLINPRSTLDGSCPVRRETEHLFLDLPAFGQQLLAYYEEHADHWRPHVLNFSRSFVANGLKRRPITRDLDWGIPVPLPGWQGKKLYIWFENIIGYLSAAIEWSYNQGQPEAWKAWWYDPDARGYYFLGKDNVPFHTIIWPSELLGIGRLYEDDPGQQLNLPYDVPANSFLTLEGRQFSSSRNWAVWLPDILTRYGADPVRYALTANMPENRDGGFSWATFVQQHNGELVAAWGNLVNRVLKFAYKHWHGRIPQPCVFHPHDRELLAQIDQGFTAVGDLLEAVKLRAALQEAFVLVRAVNGYLNEAPWFNIIQTDKPAAATTVYTALCAIDNLKLLLAPFLPHSAEKLHRLLGYKRPLFGSIHINTFHESEQSHDALVYDDNEATGRWTPGRLPLEQELLRPSPFYQKLDQSVISEEEARLG